MSTSIFDNKLVVPDDKMMAVELGSSYSLYKEICQFILKEYGDLTPEWKFYNQKSGWTLKLFHKKRNILFIGPRKDYFLVAFIFGEKAIDNVLASDLPDKIKTELATAKKYAEGRGIRIEVRTKDEADQVIQLVQIKLKN